MYRLYMLVNNVIDDFKNIPQYKLSPINKELSTISPRVNQISQLASPHTSLKNLILLIVCGGLMCELVGKLCCFFKKWKIDRFIACLFPLSQPKKLVLKKAGVESPFGLA